MSSSGRLTAEMIMMYDLCMFIRCLVSIIQVFNILNLGLIIGVSVEIYLFI
jgi:hypothetical protein